MGKCGHKPETPAKRAVNPRAKRRLAGEVLEEKRQAKAEAAKAKAEDKARREREREARRKKEMDRVNRKRQEDDKDKGQEGAGTAHGGDGLGHENPTDATDKSVKEEDLPRKGYPFLFSPLQGKEQPASPSSSPEGKTQKELLAEVKREMVPKSRKAATRDRLRSKLAANRASKNETNNKTEDSNKCDQHCACESEGVSGHEREDRNASLGTIPEEESMAGERPASGNIDGQSVAPVEESGKDRKPPSSSSESSANFVDEESESEEESEDESEGPDVNDLLDKLSNIKQELDETKAKHVATLRQMDLDLRDATARATSAEASLAECREALEKAKTDRREVQKLKSNFGEVESRADKLAKEKQKMEREMQSLRDVFAEELAKKEQANLELRKERLALQKSLVKQRCSLNITATEDYSVALQKFLEVANLPTQSQHLLMAHLGRCRDHFTACLDFKHRCEDRYQVLLRGLEPGNGDGDQNESHGPSSSISSSETPEVNFDMQFHLTRPSFPVGALETVVPAMVAAMRDFLGGGGDVDEIALPDEPMPRKKPLRVPVQQPQASAQVQKQIARDPQSSAEHPLPPPGFERRNSAASSASTGQNFRSGASSLTVSEAINEYVTRMTETVNAFGASLGGNSGSKPQVPPPSVVDFAKPRFRALVEQVRRALPGLSKTQVFDYLLQVRARHGDSLSGLTVPFIIKEVASLVPQQVGGGVESDPLFTLYCARDGNEAFEDEMTTKLMRRLIKERTRRQQQRQPPQQPQQPQRPPPRLSEQRESQRPPRFASSTTLASSPQPPPPPPLAPARPQPAVLNNSLGQRECCICLESMEGNAKRGQVIELSPCSHKFHTECVRQWLREKRDCPLCRKFTMLYDEYPNLK